MALPDMRTCQTAQRASRQTHSQETPKELFDTYHAHITVTIVSEIAFVLFEYAALHTFAIFVAASTVTAMFRERFANVFIVQEAEKRAFDLQKKVPYLTAIICLTSLIVSTIFLEVGIVFAAIGGAYGGLCQDANVYLQKLRQTTHTT